MPHLYARAVEINKKDNFIMWNERPEHMHKYHNGYKLGDTSDD